MGQAISISSVGGGGGAILPGGGDTSGTPTGAGAAPGNVSSITVSGILDPAALEITLTVSFTPGSGTASGVHCWLDIPDHGSATDATAKLTVGSSTVGTAKVAGPFEPIDLGLQTNPTQPWTFTCGFPQYTGLNPAQNIPCRLYISSTSSMTDNVLIQDGLTGNTPNCAFTLVSLASGTPTAATNVTVNCGNLVCQVMGNDNSTGKLETPIWATMGSVPSKPPAGWGYRLYISYGTADPTVPANLTAVTEVENVAGPVPPPTKSDGISTAHTFVLPTPTATTNATIWAIAGITKGGTFLANNVVPGITNSCPITFGSTSGTLDASQQMISTLAASMAVVSGEFGIAAAGVTNALMGSGAVSTLNLQALAVTNPVLAALCTQAANLASGSITTGNAALSSSVVTAGKMAANSITASNAAIAAAAIGTAGIQTAAITTALVANLAVGTAQIITGSILSAQIGTATIADSNMGTCSVSKLIAGTANFSGTATFQYGGSGPSVQINSTQVELNSSTNYVGISSSGISISTSSASLDISTTISMTMGVNTLTATSSYIEMANSSSGQAVHLTSSALTIQNGSSYGVSINGSTGWATFACYGGTPTTIGNLIYNGVPYSLTTGTINAYAITTFGGNVAAQSSGTASILSFNALTIGNVPCINNAFQFIGSGGVNCPSAAVICSSVTIGSTPVINSSFQYVGHGVSCPSYAISCSTLTVAGDLAINSSCQFVGFGVYMTGYGVTASGFNPYVSSVQYYGATGTFTYSTHVLTIKGGVITSIT